MTTTASEAKDPADKENQSNDPQDGVHEPKASKDQSQKQNNQNQSHIILPLKCARAPAEARPASDNKIAAAHPLPSDGVFHFVSRVLQVFSDILQPGLGLVRLSFVLEITISGDVAGGFFDPPLGVLGSI
jgi:hypothetical protein